MDYDDYEVCWILGEYSDQICEFCPHKEECSANENNEE